jgi:transcriptional regulator with XRE-family HTH domain
MTVLRTVASRIREFRTSYGGGKGISQEELAKELKIAPNTISRWETGTYKPGIDDLERLARFFNASILEFFPEEKGAVHETPHNCQRSFFCLVSLTNRIKRDLEFSFAAGLRRAAEIARRANEGLTEPAACDKDCGLHIAVAIEMEAGRW